MTTTEAFVVFIICMTIAIVTYFYVTRRNSSTKQANITDTSTTATSPSNNHTRNSKEPSRYELNNRQASSSTRRKSRTRWRVV